MKMGLGHMGNCTGGGGWGKAAWGLRSALCLLLAVLQAFGSVGCTRRFFRGRADKEVEAVLKQKDQFPQWAIQSYHVYPDPRARFADPSNPDRPPMPPDDPAAERLSPNPQKPGRAGVTRIEATGFLDLLAAWDAQNRAERPPEPPKVLPAPPDPNYDPQAPGGASERDLLTTPLDRPRGGPQPFLLKLEQAAELGLINSREFQDRREDLYMTALPVTVQRFAFSAQFFAAGEAIREWTGRDVGDGQHNRWRANSTGGVAQLFSTGALLLFRFANQTVVELTGRFPRDTTSTSVLNLDLIQPLLRGSGRAVTLEPLTQSERNLLYELRRYARFRKEFFVAIAGGGGGSISGGVFVPQGVIAPSTFSATGGVGGSGLFPGLIPQFPFNVDLQVFPGQAGRLNLSPAIPAPVSGYLGTLLEHAQIAIDQANVVQLQEFIKMFEGFKEGGDVSQLQVDQVEQQLLQGRSQLLQDQQQYQDSIDRFKLQLGLPTALLLELDDTPLRPLKEQFQRYEEVFREFGDASREATTLLPEKFLPRLRVELRRLFTSSGLVKGTDFRTRIAASWAAWEKLTAQELKTRLDRDGEERRKLLDAKAELEKAGKGLDPREQLRLQQLDFEIDLGNFELALRRYESQPWKAEMDARRREQMRSQAFRNVASGFVLVLGEARNERLQKLRRQWPDLPRLCVEGVDLLQGDIDRVQTVVAQTALTNRLDLMNVRAQLVDAWRQVAVFANSLMGIFNVEYHWDTTTPANQARPLAFGGSRSRHRLTMNTELPLVRVLERNNYRAALIAFQRERRAVMEAEDLVVQGVRGEIRQLRVLAENYKIQQRQVELAYLTVESALDTFQAPPPPGGAGSAAVQAASLTRQLLDAQRSVPAAQNQLLTVWINYLNTRLQMYRDLELMPLDYRGVWIDEHASRDCDTDSSHQPSSGTEGPERLPRPRSLPSAEGNPMGNPN